MTTITIEREVLHQLARRAGGKAEERRPERRGDVLDQKVDAAVRALLDATAIRGVAAPEIVVTEGTI